LAQRPDGRDAHAVLGILERTPEPVARRPPVQLRERGSGGLAHARAEVHQPPVAVRDRVFVAQCLHETLNIRGPPVAFDLWWPTPKQSHDCGQGTANVGSVPGPGAVAPVSAYRMQVHGAP